MIPDGEQPISKRDMELLNIIIDVQRKKIGNLTAAYRVKQWAQTQETTCEKP